MVDLGSVLGSLMSGLINARRMADEQTAALAEYYKDNPLLEGLSVPRIRIPELTIDLPMIIENHVAGETSKIENSKVIASELLEQIKLTIAKNNIKVSTNFYEVFSTEVFNKVEVLKQKNAPITKEALTRSVQGAFTDAQTKSRIILTAEDKENIAKDIREKILTVDFVKEPVASSIITNIKTADVKEKASSANVVRLKITLKEEGLEWATVASESGGVVRTLQPE